MDVRCAGKPVSVDSTNRHKVERLQHALTDVRKEDATVRLSSSKRNAERATER